MHSPFITSDDSIFKLDEEDQHEIKRVTLHQLDNLFCYSKLNRMLRGN